MNKSPRIDGLTAEHLFHAHPAVTVTVTKLLNLMICNEYVPDIFGHNITTSIPKAGQSKKSTCSSDYRRISINPIISKIYEICLQNKFNKRIQSSNNQYGFKKGVGCSHEICSLRKTIQYYIDRGSNIYLCSIDLVKAFDKVDHYLLFNKLLKKHCPLKFVKVWEDRF